MSKVSRRELVRLGALRLEVEEVSRKLQAEGTVCCLASGEHQRPWLGDDRPAHDGLGVLAIQPGDDARITAVLASL